MTDNQNTTGGGSSGLSRLLAIAGAVVVALGVAVGSGLMSADKGGESGRATAAETDAGEGGETVEGVDFGREHDIVMGSNDAPVWIVEYASTSCGHCRAFKEQVFPELKEKYIDTGLVKYTLREFPTAPAAAATWAFMVARCTGEAGYYRMIEAIFARQPDWAYTNDQDKTKSVLLGLARQAGLTEEEFNTCIKNEDEFQRIRNTAQEAYEKFGVSSTPSFIINGKLHSGARPLKTFEPLITAHLPDDLKPAPEAEEEEAEKTEETGGSAETAEPAEAAPGNE